jgi:hypothetical protein
MQPDDALVSPPEGTIGSGREAFLSYASLDAGVAERICC